MGIQKVKNLIIGAGPAGLAVAGRLREQNIPFEILEASDKVAWSWHNHYDRLLLHTVKDLSNLPHLKFPDHYPTYVSRKELVDYYANYAEHFDIQPQFGEKVESISKEKEVWLVKTKQGKSFLTGNVIIATGVNRVPFSPHWEGQDAFEGEIAHSRDYRNAKPFAGKKVLVIGMGNTGAELALDLSEHNIEVLISVRSPLVIVPRDINGRPVQTTGKQLEKLPFGLGDWLGGKIRKIVLGDLTKYGLPISNKSPLTLLRETGKTPVIDLGTIEHIKDGKIKVVGDVERFYEKGVYLKGGSQLKVDTVILATGYRAQMHDFLENREGLLDENDIPNVPVATGQHQGLFFVGFDVYKLGGILGTIYVDSKRVVDAIARG